MLIWSDDRTEPPQRGLPSTATVVTASSDGFAPEEGTSGPFDLIIVDGGDRAAALAHASRHLAPGGSVCLHDAQWPAYDAAKAAFRATAVVGADGADDPAWLWVGAHALAPAATDGVAPLIVSFYTAGTRYEDEAARLRADGKALGLEMRITAVQGRGSWARNTNLKARFCRDMLREMRRPVLWVDADARLRARPSHPAFDQADIALHRWDDWQLATGTMFFNATEGARRFLDAWVEWADRLPDVPDQISADLAWESVSLASPLATAWLPRTFCQIVGTPEIDGPPVIEHLMASRRLKGDVSGGVAVPYPRPSATLQTARRATRPRLWRVSAHADGDGLAPLVTEVEAELGEGGPAPDHDRLWLEEVGEALAHQAERARHRASAHHATLCATRFLARHDGPFAIYGTGAVGGQLLDACRAAGRTPRAFVVSEPCPGPCVDGFEVWTPEAARDAGIRGFLLGTHASAAAMRARLQAAFGPDVSLTIASPDAPGIDPAVNDLSLLEEARSVVAAGRTLTEYTWLRRHRDVRIDAAVGVRADAARLGHLDRYRFAAQYAGGRDVLDCASGTGDGSGWLARQAYAAHVLGVDPEADAVAYATRHYGAPQVAFVQDDPCALATVPDGSIDLVVCFETLHRVADDRAMLRAFTRVLRPTGRCIVSIPRGPSDSSRSLRRASDPDALVAALEAAFAHLVLFAQHVPSDAARGGLVPLRDDTRAGAAHLVAVCASPCPASAQEPSS